MEGYGGAEVLPHDTREAGVTGRGQGLCRDISPVLVTWEEGPSTEGLFLSYWLSGKSLDYSLQ